MRGRFNGIFQMLAILGTIIGQLIAGALGDKLPIRGIVAVSMAVTLLSVFLIMVPNGKHVKEIYNVNA
jgi:MFS family permease